MHASADSGSRATACSSMSRVPRFSTRARCPGSFRTLDQNDLGLDSALAIVASRRPEDRRHATSTGAEADRAPGRPPWRRPPTPASRRREHAAADAARRAGSHRIGGDDLDAERGGIRSGPDDPQEAYRAEVTKRADGRHARSQPRPVASSPGSGCTSRRAAATMIAAAERRRIPTRRRDDQGRGRRPERCFSAGQISREEAASGWMLKCSRISRMRAPRRATDSPRLLSRGLRGPLVDLTKGPRGRRRLDRVARRRHRRTARTSSCPRSPSS